ncbi:MAG: hypothetical protein GY795_00685 [Desulfobacterales bacterium]|nr:hypothetical protein [Desulfobacterales bacterium]
MTTAKFMVKNIYGILDAYEKKDYDNGETYKEICLLEEAPNFKNFMVCLELLDELQKQGLLKLPKTTKNRPPRQYKGWTLNKRGKNKKGKTMFNLAKKIKGKNRVKYLGVWDQGKADDIIAAADQEYGVGSQ